MNENVRVEGFYQSVAEMLQCDGHYREFPFGRRTRWNNRSPGNGRFPGHGLVRYFGPSVIQVSLINPPVSGLFGDPESALEAIRKALIH